MPGCNRCHSGIKISKHPSLTDPRGFEYGWWVCPHCFPINRDAAAEALRPIAIAQIEREGRYNP